MQKKMTAGFVAVLCAGSVLAGSKAPSEWPGITVDVKANHPVAVAQKMTTQKDGFQRLEITLSNTGKEALTIEKIAVSIPVVQPLDKELQMLYGGSCMGRTPLLRQAVGSQTKQSNSHMYEMVRLGDDQYLFAGSLSWRIFLPNFTLTNNTMVVWSDGEGKQLKPGQSIQYERIVLKRAGNWLDVLDRFGSAIAAENGIGKLKPADFKGWATWDYYGFNFSTDDLLRNMEEIKKIYPAANLFQIDAGWSTARGDNMIVRPDLPGGMKAIAEKSKAAGMTAGIWIDGFRADTKSEIFKKHPEYFLRDQDDKIIVETKKKTDEEWNHVFFDYSHPGTRAYMAECIRVIREDWGFTYFKIDFMRYGLNKQIKMQNPKVTQVKAYDSTITDLERMRLGLKTMREAVGPDNYLLGCSAVFAPCIGFVDGMRTAGDINPNFDAFAERVLGNAGNFYLSKVFNTDSDYLVFRAAADEDDAVSKEGKKSGGILTVNEAKMWADFCSLYGSCRLNSDNLLSLRPERIALVKEVFNYPAMDETVPLDLWQHATKKADGFELILARKDKKIYLGVFNWGDAAKEYKIPAFGKDGVQTLEARHSKVLTYTGSLSFDELCKTITDSLGE